MHNPSPLEWKLQDYPVSYPEALQWMEGRVSAIQEGGAPECIWFLEHPPLYTMGPRGHENDLLTSLSHPVFQTPRGGQTTYHGPGQRIVYLMLDLNTRYQDIRHYVYELEEWIIRTLAVFGVRGERREGRVGIWIQKKGRIAKSLPLAFASRNGSHLMGLLSMCIQTWMPIRTLSPVGLRSMV